jgi:NADH-quinone oxidoreductase subunit D
MPTEHIFPDSAARAAEAAESDRLEINLGPSHPSTHGVLRVRLELDGEVVTKADPCRGYLHRGDEKIAENMTYNQFVPYTDRLDYLAPLANNVAYAIAVERLAGIEVPARGQALRVIVCELARLSSHLVGLGPSRWITARGRCSCTRSRSARSSTGSSRSSPARASPPVFSRIGGMARDVPPAWLDHVSDFCDQFVPRLEEMLGLLTDNRIWRKRTEGVGTISREDAIAWGLTGPNLRASGVAFDLRKDKPYSGYEQYDFDVPVGTRGDCYDRYLVRGEEMRQSVRIVKQAIAKFPPGAVSAFEERKIVAPPKAACSRAWRS